MPRRPRFDLGRTFSILVALSLSACAAGSSSGSGSGGNSGLSGQAGANGSGGASGSSATGGTSGGTGSGGASSGSGGNNTTAGSGGTTAGTAGATGGTAGGASGGAAGGTGDHANGGAAGGKAGGAAGGTADGAAGLPASAIIVQDNFDTSTANGPTDSTKWQAYASSDTGAPVIDSSKYSSPPNSARTQGTSSGDGSFLVPLTGLPAPQNRFYVRVRINFGTGTSALTGHAAYIVGATTRDESGTELRLGASIPPGFGTAMMDLNLQNPIDSGGEVTRFSNGFTTGGNPINAAGFDFMADHWYCLEALFDGGNDAFHVWIDGTENTNIAVTNFAAPDQSARTSWAPTFNFIKIGAQNYSGDIGTVWYDDVVVATQQVGCTYNP
jgi:hypothetical protein